MIRRLRRVKGGDIVLLHDSDHRVSEGDRRHAVAALEYWLPRWKASGKRPVAQASACEARSYGQNAVHQAGKIARTK